MEITEFWTLCSANGVVLDLEQMKSIERYAGELIYWNSKVNLISRKDEQSVIEKHILHSLTILKYVDLKKKSRCLDIGTGGGLPGIPVKLARPDIEMLLVDSIQKKIKMTKMFSDHTGLKNIDAVCSRAEDLTKQKKYKTYFDYVISRAVSKTGKLIGMSEELLKPNGKIILLKGGNLDGEINSAIEVYPEFNIKVQDINFVGAEWFKKDEKKIVICEKKK